jgi:hypothetical protein
MDFYTARQKMINSLEDFTKQYPIKTEAIYHIKNIIEFGILTLDYQMGCNSNDLREDGMYHIYKERAYIKGFMKHRDGYEFINWINSYTDKIAYFVHGDTSERFEEEYYGKDVSRTPSIVVSMEGLSDSKECGILIPKKKISTVLVKSSIDFDKMRAHLCATEDVCMIVCIDPVYGRENELYIDMIQGLNKLSSHN